MQQTLDETITVLTLRTPLADLSLDSQEAVLAGGDLFSSDADGADLLGNQDDTDVQVQSLPALPVSNPLANSVAVPPLQSSSSVPDTASSDRRHFNGKAPRHLELQPKNISGKAPRSGLQQAQPMPIRPFVQRHPAQKHIPEAPDTMQGAAEVEFSDINEMTPVHLTEWATSVIGGPRSDMARGLGWGVHQRKLVVNTKDAEEKPAERKRIQAVRDTLASLMFTNIDGEPVLGALAPSGRAYQNAKGQSVLRLIDVNRDEIVAKEERILPVDTDRVRYTHIYV